MDRKRMSEEQKARKAREARIRRGCLVGLNLNDMRDKMYEISDAAYAVHWYDSDEEALEDALGDEEEAFEFKMAFSEVEAKADELREIIDDMDIEEEDFNTVVVSMLGSFCGCMGYDAYDDDYYGMTRWEADRLTENEQERLKRMTKDEMIRVIGGCWNVVMAYVDLRQRFDVLHDALELIQGEQQAITDVVKGLEDEYDKAIADDSLNWRRWDTFDKLLEQLPDRAWLE